MSQSTLVKKLPGALVGLLAAAALTVASPTGALADTVVAHSVDASGNRTEYTSVTSAMSAGYRGSVIIMDTDWDLSDTLNIADSKSITIDMCGHRISGQNSHTVIRMNENSHLTLQSSSSATISYWAYDSYDSGGDAARAWETAWCGGMVTDGYSSSTAGGIKMDGNNELTLDNIVVGGNEGDDAGGIYVYDDSTIYLKNNARVTGNASTNGGGIGIVGDEVNVRLNNSSINYNVAYKFGGGVDADGDANRIFLENNSEISGNSAQTGGGVYFNYSYFCLGSDDGTGKVEYNTAEHLKDELWAMSGGAVYVNSVQSTKNEGDIRGITFNRNSTDTEGGAIYANQEYTNIINCTFTNNTATKDGGAVYINNDHCSIKGCTIKNNYCGTDYEGGGVFVPYCYDLAVSGKCLVEGNTRGEYGTDDDIFLSANVGNTARAYLTGSVAAGSNIGVRTGIDGDRKIGNKISCETTSCFFIDLENYYVDYSTSNEVWQRKGTQKFTLKVNGKVDGTYRSGASLFVNGNSDAGSGRVFKCWDEPSSTGLSPFSNYVGDANASCITLLMPQNDVNLVATYIDTVKNVTVAVEEPKVGSYLSTQGTISWDGGSSFVVVTWLDEEGNQAWEAKPGAKYRAVVSLAQSKSSDRVFNTKITKDNVKFVYSTDGTDGPATESASVNSVGTLTASSEWVQMGKSAIESVEGASISVNPGTSMDELLAALPSSAKVTLEGGSTATVATDKTGDIEGLDELLSDGSVADPGSDSKTYTVKVPLDSKSDAAAVNGEHLEVSVTVVASKDVAAPVVSPASGTYLASQLKELKLAISASCATAGATVKYAFAEGDGWGEEKAYKDELSLECPANGTKTYNIKLWAEKTVDGETVKSGETVVEYTLDDTRDKTITVDCSDTALYTKGESRWTTAFEVTADLGESITLTAPEQEDRVFDHWVQDGKTVEGEALEIDNFSTDLKIEAVYTPVISKIDLGVQVPQADKALAQEASYVKVGTAEATQLIDITDYFSDGAKLAWSPSAEDGNAEHDTAYTVMLSLSSISSDDGVKYVLADSPKLYINGHAAENLDGGAYVATDANGNEFLCASFPKTGPYKYKFLTQPDDVELTFDEASAYVAGDKSGWGLPEQVEVGYTCGEVEMRDIEWNEVEGFDESATGEQELEVTGTVKYRSSFDNMGAPKTVTVKIKVAAPEKDDSGDGDDDKGDDSGKGDSGDDDRGDSGEEDGGKTDDGSDKSGSSATPDSAKKNSHKSGAKLAETGDAAWAILPVAALGIIATAGGAVLTKRRIR